jgi:hypothetical protein
MENIQQPDSRLGADPGSERDAKDPPRMNGAVDCDPLLHSAPFREYGGGLGEVVGSVLLCSKGAGDDESDEVIREIQGSPDSSLSGARMTQLSEGKLFCSGSSRGLGRVLPQTSPFGTKYQI